WMPQWHASRLPIKPCLTKKFCYFGPPGARSLPYKSEPLLKSAKKICGASPLAHERGIPWTRAMSNSFPEFLARLQSQDDAAAQELFVRFAHQLIGLAQRHIGAGLRHKVDPEDVVQSAYKSFFFRYGAGNLDVVNWNSLWGLLTLITVRKCAERAAYHRAECRDAAREVSLPPGNEATPWLDPLGREPTPLEAAVLSETIDQLLSDLDEEERPILELSLLG